MSVYYNAKMKPKGLLRFRPGKEPTTDAERDAMPHKAKTCSNEARPYYCTRPAGHDGLHVAGTFDRVSASWETGDNEFSRDDGKEV